jgi:hypothetical protein
MVFLKELAHLQMNIEVSGVVLSAQLVLAERRLNVLVISLQREVADELKLEVLVPALVDAGNLLNGLLRIMEFAVLNEQLPLSEMGPEVLRVLFDEDDALCTVPVLVVGLTVLLEDARRDHFLLSG